MYIYIYILILLLDILLNERVLLKGLGYQLMTYSPYRILNGYVIYLAQKQAKVELPPIDIIMELVDRFYYTDLIFLHSTGLLVLSAIIKLINSEECQTQIINVYYIYIYIYIVPDKQSKREEGSERIKR